MLKAKVEGCYLLYKDKEVVYVGESNNIYWRIGRHVNDKLKDFDSFEIIPCADRKNVESFLIAFLKPKYNENWGSFGREHSEWQVRCSDGNISDSVNQYLKSGISRLENENKRLRKEISDFYKNDQIKALEILSKFAEEVNV